MYEAFYGLSAEPFRLTPDHRFSFRHRSYARAKAYLEYGVRRAEGFVMITGRPGTGKTTLINDLLDGLENAGVSIARLVSTQVEAGELLRLVAFSFGLDAEAVDKATLLRRLELFLRQDMQAGRRAVLIVDEAQDVSAGALEELRLLTNLVFMGQPLLQVFLVGQEELRSVVRSKPLEQLHQRMIAACHLQPLSPRETRAYVEYRLKRVGWRNDPEFDEALYDALHEFSLGVPRRINQVCSRLLLHGFVEEKHRLDETDLEAVLTDLREEMLNPWDEEPGAPSRRVVPTPQEDAADEQFEFDPVDLDPPVIDEDSKKKDLPEPSGLDESEAADDVDLGEMALEVPSWSRREPEVQEAPGPVPLARIETVKMPADEVRRGNADEPAIEPDKQLSRSDGVRRTPEPDAPTVPPRVTAASGRTKAEAVYLDPAERRPPQPAASRGKDPVGGFRRSGAALVIVLGVLAVLLGGLVVVRSVPGPWTPEVERAESWLQEEWHGLRTQFSGGFLPEPPAGAPDAGLPAEQSGGADAGGSPLAAADQIAAAKAQEALATPVSAGSPERLAEADGAPASAAAAPDAGEIRDGYDLMAAARAAFSGEASAESRHSAAGADPLRLVQRQLREELGDVGLKLWQQGDGSLYLDFVDPISFGYDSATLAEEYTRVLANLSEVLKPHSVVTVRLVGWTDTRGDPVYNQQLSEQRAQAVAELLRAHGLEAERLQVEGRGAVTAGLFDPHASRRVDVYLKAP